MEIIYIDLGSPNNKQTLLSDLNYLAKTYFDQPFYLRIKNAPERRQKRRQNDDDVFII